MVQSTRTWAAVKAVRVSLPMADEAVAPQGELYALAEVVLKARTLVGAADILRAWACSKPPSSDWYSRILRLANRLADGRPALNLFVMDGNTKLPFAAWSVLPFFTCPGMGECEAFCYSTRAWRYPDGFGRQLQNTLLFKHRPSLIRRAFRRLPADIYFRLFVDGDFSSTGDVRFWMQRFQERSDILAYGYSKSWDILWRYGQRNAWPANYVLNLSSGGREQRTTLDQMMTLPIARNRFIGVELMKEEYRPMRDGKPIKGNVGFARYDDPAYHAAVRRKAKEMGLGSKVFSCPGKCGECSPRGHVCGSHAFDNVVVAIGVH